MRGMSQRSFKWNLIVFTVLGKRAPRVLGNAGTFRLTSLDLWYGDRGQKRLTSKKGLRTPNRIIGRDNVDISIPSRWQLWT